jgi:heterotetrameric sarcosine oxidase gamma subunit
MRPVYDRDSKTKLAGNRAGLDQLMVRGRHGAPVSDAGVEIALCGDRALVAVMARKGQGDTLRSRVAETFGLELPHKPRRVASDAIAFVWAGPGYWLAIANGLAGHALEVRLRGEFAEFASVSDQSDNRVVIRIGGRHAREALAKGVMIDLHPRAFAPGDAAVTSVAHVGAHFWQLDAVPTYEFAVPRSLAVSFWHWLIASSAEFGIAVR